MSEVKFSPEERSVLVGKIQRYLEDEMDHEIGQFEAEFLLDFLSRELGPHFYNRGLYDAQAVFEAKMEMVTDAIYEIEQPVRNN